MEFFDSTFERQRSTDFHPRGNKSLNKVLCVLPREARKFLKKSVDSLAILSVARAAGSGQANLGVAVGDFILLVKGKNLKLQGQFWSEEREQ